MRTRRKYHPDFLQINALQLDMPLIEAFGYHAFDTAIYSGRRTTQCFHLTYIATKSTSWEIEGDRTLHVHAGQIGLIQPGLIHRGEWGHDRPNAHFWFYFDPSHLSATRNTSFDPVFMNKAVKALREAGNCVWQVDEMFDLSCWHIYQKLQGRLSETDRVALRTLICQIFYFMFEKAFDQRGDESQTQIQEILGQIEEHLDSWKNLSELAEHFKMDAVAFQYFFKHKVGLSPWNYVLYQRCKKACAMLRQSPINITRLAYDLGFSSSQHFSTTFKQYIGVPPKEFRRDSLLIEPSRYSTLVSKELSQNFERRFI